VSGAFSPKKAQKTGGLLPKIAGFCLLFTKKMRPEKP